MHTDRTSSTRFPVPVDAALRSAGWRPGRWDIKQAEYWADTLRAHTSPAGHQHTILPAAVEAWAEFGALRIVPTGTGRHIAPTTLHLDPLHGVHMARVLSDLGRALDTQVCPIGEEISRTAPDANEPRALIAMDAQGRVYSLDHTGDWYLGPNLDHALTALISGTRPQRLTAAP